MNSTCWRSAAAIVAAVGALATITACTSPSVPAPGGKLAASFVALVEECLASGTVTEFETQVLTRAKGRGTISQSDYETARDRYRECMANKGITTQERRYPNGIIHSTSPAPAPDELYSVQQGNPDLFQDRSEAGAACLVREGIAPQSFSRDDFVTAFDGPGFSEYDSLPFDVRDERVHMCLYVAGIVIGFAD